MPEENRQGDKGIRWEWLEEFLDNKGALYNCTEAATRGVKKVILKNFTNFKGKHLR